MYGALEFEVPSRIISKLADQFKRIYQVYYRNALKYLSWWIYVATNGAGIYQILMAYKEEYDALNLKILREVTMVT